MAQFKPRKSPTVAQRLTGVVLNYHPQPGMWAATGTAIAYAPTLGELRHPVNGGKDIVYNAHGQGARSAPSANPEYPAVTTTEIKAPAVLKRTNTVAETPALVDGPAASPGEDEGTRVPPEKKHSWKETSRHALAVGWKFVRTPTGFLMTIYGLNIVAWGAMLFLLLLNAAPAMDHPNTDTNDSPRKKWIEIDSQILNALFCVTGFGLAPWRFRDLYWMVQTRLQHNQHAMMRLAERVLVPASSMVSRSGSGERTAGEANHIDGRGCTAHESMEVGVCRVDDGAQHFDSVCSVRHDVGI